MIRAARRRLSYMAWLAHSRVMQMARRSDDAGMRRFTVFAWLATGLVIAAVLAWVIATRH